MSKFYTTSNVKHNDVDYPAGSEIELSDEEAKILGSSVTATPPAAPVETPEPEEKSDEASEEKADEVDETPDETSDQKSDEASEDGGGGDEEDNL